MSADAAVAVPAMHGLLNAPAGAPPESLPWLGEGLLPVFSGEDHDGAVLLLQVAYLQLAGGREENYRVWEYTRREVVQGLKDQYQAHGLSAPPFQWDAFWARVDKPMPWRDPNEHVALVGALLTDYGARLVDHIVYRLTHGGNVHLQFKGPTGMAKSSCAIRLADWIRQVARGEGIDPARLSDYLSFDVPELPARLRDKLPGETVIQDEYVATAGEGARTYQSLFSNLEDTLRGSQVSLFVLSPRDHDHATMQATLEVVMWDVQRRFSVFLVWLEGQPHGVVALPWAAQPHWQAYTPWKAQNVERSKSGHFRDNAYLVRATLRAFDNENLLEFLLGASNKPRKRDMLAALGLFFPQMQTTGQTEGLASFMEFLCHNFERVEPSFQKWFGLEPNAGLRRVAEKCYQE